MTNLMEDYYCPPDNYTVPLIGTYSSSQTSTMRVDVAMCTQDYLDYHYTRKGLKCKTENEIMGMIPYTNLRFALATDYLDA